MTFIESEGGVPSLGTQKYDVIIAMDSLEHVQEWRRVLGELATHLAPGGVLFANNAILDDDLHPEHYHIDQKAFVVACIEVDLMPANAITYLKRAAEVPAGVARVA